LIGADPERHLLNLEGRVVFELPQEKALPLKKALKRAYDLEGRPLSINRLAQRYGADLPVLQDIRRNRLRAVLYSGGYFWAGHRTNALNKARAMGCTVFEAASAVRIRIDAGASKSRIEVRLGDQVKTLLANTVLLAAGDYGPDIIPVDGVSTLFAVETAHRDYRLLPTGMGEGGTIHIVPVETLSLPRNGEMHYYHLGKATNGAVIGRDPFRPKRVQRDRDFIRHLEVHLKKIIPSGSRLLWLTLTACGRPVVAGQGYRVAPLISGSNVGFEAAGGCGLGGNTPIIPQVQAALERRAGAAKQPMLQEQEGS